jgi:hypothetical protein
MLNSPAVSAAVYPGLENSRISSANQPPEPCQYQRLGKVAAQVILATSQFRYAPKGSLKGENVM